ncbi:MAG TPA: hypothetical protein VL307_19665 [Chitinophagaceae bacterium]|nr:hypothetical protein [Chitinophagaceae bacterium]
MRNVKAAGLITALILFCAFTGQSQKARQRKGEFYFSWGYNTEWYTHSSIKISQPSLGNDYSFKNIRGHDHRGWDEGLFSKALTIPQYNYRIGYFFGNKQDWGIEINFDHTKFIVSDNQLVHIKGMMNNKPVDKEVRFVQNDRVGADSSSYYFLNNGANFLLFNIMKRWHLSSNRSGTIKLDGISKFGIGPLIPHVQNKFFDQPENNPDFQIGGWNTGIEGALRGTFYRHVYLEFAGKLDYARYAHLHIYQGSARQAFGTAELILSLGISLGK